MAIPGLYLLLSNFFVIDLRPFGLTTSKIYAIIIIFYFLYHATRNFKSIINDKLAVSCSLLVLTAITFPAVYHYLIWKEWPLLFLDSHIKSLWGLGFFFLPKEKINFQEFFNFLALSFLASLMLIAPSSIIEYYRSGNGLGRELTPAFPYTYDRNAPRPLLHWFIMDDNTQENMSITAAVMVSFIFNKLFDTSSIRSKLVPLTLFGFTTYILYLNQYLSSIILLLFSTFVSLILYSEFGKWDRPKILKSAIFFTAFAVGIVVAVTNDNINSKYTSRFNISSERTTLKPNNRLTIFAGVIPNWLKNFPLTGSGFPRNYEDSKTPINLPMTQSGHSTVLDNFISFGIMAGMAANLIYFLPLLYLIKLRKMNYELKTFATFVNFFLTTFILTTETIFGRESLQIGSYIGSTVILLTYYENLKKMKVDTPLSSQASNI